MCLNLSSIHTQNVKENSNGSGNPEYIIGKGLYPYSHGYINFIKTGDDTLVAYDLDGLGTAYTQ